MNKERFIDSLKENDIEYLEDLVNSSQMYLYKKISNIDIILILSRISSFYLEYEDPKLTAFLGIWSQAGDIEDEIKTGEASQQDVDEYIQSMVPIMKECCHEIIEEYTPILEELKKKYPRPKKSEEDLDWDEWLHQKD